MNRYFTTNVLRMFQNRKIYICTLGMALTLYMSGIAFIRSDGDSANLQDAFSVVSSSGFIILFYLLCVIGGGLSYCEDCNSGFTRYAVVRGDAKKYIRGHLFSAALGGCASMLGGMALYELLMIFTLWPIKGSFYAMFSQNHAYFIQNIWNALLLSLLGAVLAGLAMTVTACIPNIFVGTAMPILIYYMVIGLSNKYAPLELGPILPAWVYFGNAEFLGGRNLADALCSGVYRLYLLCFVEDCGKADYKEDGKCLGVCVTISESGKAATEYSSSFCPFWFSHLAGKII